MEKMVRKDVYLKIKEVFENRDFSNVTDEEIEFVIERMDKDIEQVSKKRTNTAKTEENRELADKVYEYMKNSDAEVFFTADIMNEFDVNNQKAGYIARMLKDEGKIVANDKKIDGKVNYSLV